MFDADHSDHEDWLHERWLDLVTPLTSDHFGVHATWHALHACYTDARRSYHNLAHVADLLRLADAQREHITHPEIIEFAIWFHDAIYQTRSNDNERRSAVWARQALEAMSLDRNIVAAVEACILATEAHQLPDVPIPDLPLFLDLDLSILAAPDATYDTYRRRIREEYAWVSDTDYRVARAAVLQRFADRPQIYFTPHLAERFEARARYNIARELESLDTS